MTLGSYGENHTEHNCFLFSFVFNIKINYKNKNLAAKKDKKKEKIEEEGFNWVARN